MYMQVTPSSAVPAVAITMRIGTEAMVQLLPHITQHRQTTIMSVSHTYENILHRLSMIEQGSSYNCEI